MTEKLSEEELIAKASKWNLKLISDYKDYKNKNSILDWMCKNCGHKFLDSVNNLRGLKYHCEECRKIKRSLFFDEVKRVKECSRCSQILSYSCFTKQSGLRGSRGNAFSYKWICKECYNKFRLIKRFRKKFRLINEFFHGKCYRCELNLIWLLSFHFHHPDIRFKTKEWDDVKDSKYSIIENWAYHDSVIPLCGNCHKYDEALTFLKFKNLILKPDLFSMTPKQVDLLLDKVVQNGGLKYEVKEWIRKRYIIEKVFSGYCIGCGDFNVLENLPSLIFHHPDSSIKENKIKDILNFDCEAIYRIILKERVVCLCSNCHSFIHSEFYKYINEFINDKYFQQNFSDNNLKKFKSKFINIRNQIIENISRFKFKKLDIKSPLKLEFNQTQNIWKIHLLEVYYTKCGSNKSYVNVSDFMKIFYYPRGTAMMFLNRLSKRGYIKKFSLKNRQVRYDLTDIGLEKISKLTLKHRKKAIEINNIVKSFFKENI